MTEFLTLEKQNNILNGMEFIEYLPKNRIQALLASGILLLDWGEKFSFDLNKEKVREHYANEVLQMKGYLKAYNPVLGGVKVKYTRWRQVFGRVYSAFNYGFTPFRRVVRNSLILDLYYDFDLVSAHQAIVVSLCKRANIPCPIIKKYVEQRDLILKETCEFYNVDKDEAKDLFIRLNFGGGFEKWVVDNKIIKTTPTDFVVSYQREVKDIADKFKAFNKPLWEVIKGRKIKEEEALRSFFATYLQEWEVRIVSSCLNHLLNETSYLKHPKLPNCQVPIGSYEYDGFKLLKENVDKFGSVENVLNLLHEKTAELGFPDLRWKCKDIDDFTDLSDWVNQICDSEAEDAELKAVCEKITRISQRGDTGVIEFINELYPNHFIYSLEQGDKASQGNWFCWDGKRWRSNELPLRNVITYDVEKKLEELLLPFTHYEFDPIDDDDEPTANQELYMVATKKKSEIVCKGCKANDVNNAITQAKQIFANYTLEFDTKPYLLGFENGVLDIEEKLFRPYHFEDKVSFSCGYNFVPYNSQLKVIDEKGAVVPTPFVKNDIAYERVKKFFEEIITNPEERKFVRIIQASGMVGKAVQLFNVYNGNGRNGKGILNNFTADAYGDYAVKVSASVFTEVRKNSANSNPEVAKIDKKRFGYTREPPKDLPFQNSVVKDLTGSGSYEARMNHSNKTKVLLLLTWVCECNDKPNFAETPNNAESDRIRDVLFGSRFTDEKEEVDDVGVFLKDNNLEETFKGTDYKVALINLLLDDLFELHEAKYNVEGFTPNSIKVRSLNYLNSSNDINNLFEEVFELRQEGIDYKNVKGESYDENWTLPQIAGVIRSGLTSYFSLPKKKQKEMTKEKIVEFFTTNKIYKKLVVNNTHRKAMELNGYRLKVKEEEVDC